MIEITNEAIQKLLQKKEKERFNYIILSFLKQYAYVFKNKKILKENKSFGDLSFIAETFQRCYLDSKNTDLFFSKL